MISSLARVLLFCVPLVAAQAAVVAPLELQLITNNLSKPVAIAHARDGSGRLFVALQDGQIHILDDGQLLPQPFLDLGPVVSCCIDRGLFGIAFHPQYASNGFFYVHYSRPPDDASVIARYSVSADPNIADTNGVVILTIEKPSVVHSGGQLEFGPDGYFYVAIGDGSASNDPFNFGQTLTNLLGKILRIDVDSAFPYAIPSSNPFVTNAAASAEIWAYGLRNPWRFSFDRLTGDLFIADVGQNTYEEVNFQPATSAGGENYGWRLMEGTHCFNPPTNCNDGTLTMPIIEYSHQVGCAVMGGYRYRGSKMPLYFGTYFYGDFCSGRIWGATQEGTNWITTELSSGGFRISAFGEDEAGELYVAHFSTNGSVYRIVSPFYPPGDLNGDKRVAGTDSLLINQVLVGLRTSNDLLFAAAGFQNGDLDQSGEVTGVDSLLINQTLVGLRPYITTKVVPDFRTNTLSRNVAIFGMGFPTDSIPEVRIEEPVSLTLSNVVVISREQIQAIVPTGGGSGTGTVSVIGALTNGTLSFGTFINP